MIMFVGKAGIRNLLSQGLVWIELDEDELTTVQSGCRKVTALLLEGWQEKATKGEKNEGHQETQHGKEQQLTLLQCLC